MCYQLKQVHLNCPRVNLPGETGIHTVESLIRCSSPQPCRGQGFGTLTKTYSNQDYCQSCLGSVVAARATQPAPLGPTCEFQINTNEDEFVANILTYVDHLLEFGMLALHESLHTGVLRNRHLYPMQRLLTTLLWETMCLRCRLPLQCRCRPGRNEASWNVARYARTVYAKKALQKYHVHTTRQARAQYAVQVRNDVHDVMDVAVPAMSAHPVSYDVAPFSGDQTGDRFSWIAHDMLDDYRLQPVDEPGIAEFEMCDKFDIIELLSSIIAHDTGVPDEAVRAIGSRLLPIVMLTHQRVTAQNIPPLTTPYDRFQMPRSDGSDNNSNSNSSSSNSSDDDNGSSNADVGRRTIILPVANLLQDGVFQTSLVQIIRLESLFIRDMYRNPASVAPRFRVPGNPARNLGPRFRGRFEITIRAINDDLMSENTAMVRWEANRQAYWRSLLVEVHAGVEMLTTDVLPQGGGSTTPSVCLMHLTDFYEDTEMEEPRLQVHGGDLEPQPLHRHGPIRFANCAPSESPHAFCMVGLAEWTFIRQLNPIDQRLWVEDMRERKCPQCMRVLQVNPN